MPPLPLEEKEPHAAGKKVYNANGCMRCHAMGVQALPKDAPPLPKKGPDLAKVASKAGRNAEWFIDFVSDPRKTNPDSKMPPFEGKIQPQDLRALAEFLTSLQ